VRVAVASVTLEPGAVVVLEAASCKIQLNSQAVAVAV